MMLTNIAFNMFCPICFKFPCKLVRHSHTGIAYGDNNKLTILILDSVKNYSIKNYSIKNANKNNFKK